MYSMEQINKKANMKLVKLAEHDELPANHDPFYITYDEDNEPTVHDEVSYGIDAHGDYHIVFTNDSGAGLSTQRIAPADIPPSVLAQLR